MIDSRCLPSRMPLPAHSSHLLGYLLSHLYLEELLQAIEAAPWLTLGLRQDFYQKRV
jgi:hypothetical protein